MPSPPKSDRAPKVVRKVLADGTVREYRYARGPARPDLPGAGTVPALLAAFRGSPEYARLAPATKRNYRLHMRPWEHDRWHAVAVRDVTRRDVLTLRDALAAASGPGSATAFGRITSTLFGWALDRGWIEHSPATRIRGLARGHLPDWGEEAIAAALDGLSDELRRVVVLGLYTGQRRGDLAAMTWGQVRGERIALTQGKTGKALLIPIHPDLAAEMARWRGGEGGHILRTQTGLPWNTTHLSRSMGWAMTDLGFPGLNIHGLRKAAARRLAEAGCSAHEIAAITGHTTLAMVQLYTEAVRQEQTAEAAIVKLRRVETKR